MSHNFDLHIVCRPLAAAPNDRSAGVYVCAELCFKKSQPHPIGSMDIDSYQIQCEAQLQQPRAIASYNYDCK